MSEKTIIKYLWHSFGVGIFLIIAYLFSVQVNFCNLYGGMPSPDLLENPQSELASEVYSADGLLLGKYFRDNRSPVTYDQVSPNMIHALIASEDIRFEEHAGIDLRGLARAFIFSILLRRKQGGGSTLTQQLAKNLFNVRRETTYQGKFSTFPFLGTLIHKTKEWILAVQLERAYTKQEIIAMYLNTVTFGSNTYGIKVAARTFFNKTPAQLHVEEAAVLVGILRGPSRYSPVTQPKRAKNVRNAVLAQMMKYKFLKKTDYDILSELPIELHYQAENYTEGLAPYFRSVLRKFLLKWSRDNGYDLFVDGLRIYTTIDSRIQQHAETALKEHMKTLQHTFDEHWQEANPWVIESGTEIVGYIETKIKQTDFYRDLLLKYGEDTQAIDNVLNTPVPMQLFSWEGPIKMIISPLEAFKHHAKILQAGCMAMDPHTGHIKAWVGGIDYKYFKYDHVKDGKRQPGSTFKPIVYTVALDNGYLPTDLIVDQPVTFLEADGKTWTAQNAWKRYSGQKRTLRYAMAQSYNSITSYLIKQLTPQLVVDYAKRMGIKSRLDPVPSLCLGTSDVSIYEMVGAYGIFLNKGVWTEPFFITHIEDKNGNVIQKFTPQSQEAIHEDTADLMTYMLQGSVDEGALNGIAEELRVGNWITGKSGTTSNHSDGWFIGLSHDLCVGVWVGGEDRCIHFRDFKLGSGRAMACPIWEKLMLKLYHDPQIMHKRVPLLDIDTVSEKVRSVIKHANKANDYKGVPTIPDVSTKVPTKKTTIDLDINKIY